MGLRHSLHPPWPKLELMNNVRSRSLFPFTSIARRGGKSSIRLLLLEERSSKGRGTHKLELGAWLRLRVKHRRFEAKHRGEGSLDMLRELMEGKEALK